MNLVVDIGNSRIKTAIFEGREMIDFQIFETLRVTEIKQIEKKYAFKYCIMSSVRSKQPYFVQYLSRNYDLIVLDHKTKTGLKSLYKTRKTLGRDRIAASVGGANTFKNKNVLVIDLGTCIKYDFVSKEGIYEGGNIAPGLFMRLEAMHNFTSQLPLVKPKWNENLLGKSTKEALQNGAVRGISYEIADFIKTLTKKKGRFQVILTGGDADFFARTLESKIFVDPYLVLKGLNDILLYNKT
ncbi:MAG: type III pantothenate kinase [Saprospiraceae bacterium]|nr:type III pantothenate kinase [Saprospiraceae bacterium]